MTSHAPTPLMCTRYHGEPLTTGDLRDAAESLDVDGDWRADALRDAADEIERLAEVLRRAASMYDTVMNQHPRVTEAAQIEALRAAFNGLVQMTSGLEKAHGR